MVALRDNIQFPFDGSRPAWRFLALFGVLNGGCGQIGIILDVLDKKNTETATQRREAAECTALRVRTALFISCRFPPGEAYCWRKTETATTP